MLLLIVGAIIMIGNFGPAAPGSAGPVPMPPFEFNFTQQGVHVLPGT